MRKNRYIFTTLFFLLCQFSPPAFSQLGISFDIKKPKQFEDRELKSEKSEEKKFTLPRRFIQNTVTHYNYFFNANNKLNEIVDRAKESHQDDYSQLIPFYNYSLDMTSRDSLQLDSVISKAMAGIVLHDLRNDWIDNMYLLWGAAYYLRKEFDSAYLTFQFINYAFADKEKDGYYRYIGSRLDGNNALSISTREKNTLPRRLLTEPPSRNDAFIWQIRTFIAMDAFAEAASLIETLKSDPVFPDRLRNDLEEVQAWWFYKQNSWDSAAHHLELALGNATTKQEKARWEYLIGQMYERAGKFQLAESFYAKAIKHTTDPVLEIYARLNTIRTNKNDGENTIARNIAELLKMAKRDKYSDYRDVIYYMAAQMELERNNIDEALALLQKGTAYNSGNEALRNRAFLQMAELSFGKRKYRQAYNFYDSLRLDDPSLPDPQKLVDRKNILGRIASQIEIIERQDSLQRIAGLPEEERRELIRKKVKQMRKEMGLKDEGVSSGSNLPVNTASTDIFQTGQTKGEWYFYNNSLRTRGAVDFRARWGNRPNTDNWRRFSELNATIRNPATPKDAGTTLVPDDEPTEISFDGLYNKLPLTPEAIKKSDDSIQQALFALGKLYMESIEDCSAMIETYESLRRRFPSFNKMDEVLFNLYYCYGKSGDQVKASEARKLLNDGYPASNFNAIVTTGKDPRDKTTDPAVTRIYEDIYDLFIEGKFSEALERKKNADSVYGETYWSAQQSYIEAVYYISERKDSEAQSVLAKIVAKNPGTPLAAKATNLSEVLGRRAEIEEELRNYQMSTPPADDTMYVRKPVIKTDQPVDTTVVKTQQPPLDNNNTGVKADTTIKKTFEPPVKVTGVFSNNPAEPHYVMIILNKVDNVFTNEAKNAVFRYNREKFFNQVFELWVSPLDGENKLLLVKPFANATEALAYAEQAKSVAGSQIMPWLKQDKYSFGIISEKNLLLLQANPDLPAYRDFLGQVYPGKF